MAAVDIAVAGAGVVGLTTAIALAEAGLSTRVIASAGGAISYQEVTSLAAVDAPIVATAPGSAPAGGEVRHGDAEPGLDQPQHRRVVERARVLVAAGAERGDDQARGAEAEPDGAGDAVRARRERRDREVLPGRARGRDRRCDVVEEAAVLVVVDDE